MPTLYKSLFLDRDGTLIHNIPYLQDPQQVKLLPGTIDAFKLAIQLGFKLFLFTNQSAIGRGIGTLEAVNAVNDRMLELIGLGPDLFTQICIAPEAPGQPVIYRKPSSRFILEMIRAHNLDSKHTYMLGDRMCDLEAGKNAHIQSIYLSQFTAASFEEQAQIRALNYPTYLTFNAFISL